MCAHLIDKGLAALKCIHDDIIMITNEESQTFFDGGNEHVYSPDFIKPIQSHILALFCSIDEQKS